MSSSNHMKNKLNGGGRDTLNNNVISFAPQLTVKLLTVVCTTGGAAMALNSNRPRRRAWACRLCGAAWEGHAYQNQWPASFVDRHDSLCCGGGQARPQ